MLQVSVLHATYMSHNSGGQEDHGQWLAGLVCAGYTSDTREKIENLFSFLCEA